MSDRDRYGAMRVTRRKLTKKRSIFTKMSHLQKIFLM